jgi:hypothetical protein
MSRDIIIATALIGGAFYLYETQINSSVEKQTEVESPIGDPTAEEPAEEETPPEEQGGGPSVLDTLGVIGLGLGIGVAGDLVKSRIDKTLEDRKAKAEADADKKAKADADAKAKADADAKATLKTQAEIDAKAKADLDAKAKAQPPNIDTKPTTAGQNAVTQKQNDLKLAETKAKAELEAKRISAEKLKADNLAKAVAQTKKLENVSKLSKLTKLAKGTPWGFLFTALTMTLSAVLDLSAESFNPCGEGEFDFNSIPMWAKMILEQWPFVGDIYAMFGDLLCASDKCDKTEESGSGFGAGFCYKPCNESFRSDGATLCWKQYPTFENNGQLHTITSVTKSITLNTGKPLSTCDPSQEKNGLLCYPKCKTGMKGVGPVCWANLQDVGVGTPVQLESCPAGWVNDGLTCREPLRWDGCCSRGLFNECYGCAKGGNVVGRLNNGGTCPSDREKIDGLCYKRCPAGMSHVPGMPYLCRTTGVPVSEGRGAGFPMKCARGETEISGLCYNTCPSGSVMQSLGLCSQSCPAGSTDFGVGCTRESYSRGAGRPKILIKVKSRAFFRKFDERVRDTFTGGFSGREATSFIAN